MNWLSAEMDKKGPTTKRLRPDKLTTPFPVHPLNPSTLPMSSLKLPSEQSVIPDQAVDPQTHLLLLDVRFQLYRWDTVQIMRMLLEAPPTTAFSEY